MDSKWHREAHNKIHHLLVACAEEGGVEEPMVMREPVGVEEPRAGQEQRVAKMRARDVTQIMSSRRQEVRRVADGHHKEMSGDAMEADTNREHHHRSFLGKERERLPLS